MWIAREANPFGRLSIRNLLLFVAAVCAASFAYILMAAPVTHAADVSWNGDSLIYGKDSYVRQADAPQGNSMGLEKGNAPLYLHRGRADKRRTSKNPLYLLCPECRPDKSHLSVIRRV